MPVTRILIVDDELYVRKALKRALSKYEIVLAADGQEAIDHIQSEPFDVVLCDLLMPSVSGIDVYQHVSEHSPGQEERFVFLTGGTVNDKTDEFLARLPNPVLEKPFHFGRLRSIVETVIERHRGQPAQE